MEEKEGAPARGAEHQAAGTVGAGRTARAPRSEHSWWNKGVRKGAAPALGKLLTSLVGRTGILAVGFRAGSM